MADFVKVADVGQMSDPGKELVEVDGRLVVLLFVGGQYYCIDDVCTHDGGTLGEGCLEGTEIICPRHGARFDITDGRAVTMPATQPTAVHEVKVDEGVVLVRLSS